MTDDLSVLLAVARAGSLSGAAKALGVSHSTVVRRLRELERDLGARLTELAGNQVVLTHHGHDAVRVATRIEDDVWRLSRRVSRTESELNGEIRLTTVDFLAAVYASNIQRFCTANPGVTVDIMTTTNVLNIARGEADIALRIGEPNEDSLIGRVVDRLAFGVYGRRIDSTEDRDIHSSNWLGYSGRDCGRYTESWRERSVPNGRVVAMVSTPLIMAAMIGAGVGVGLLPRAVGDANPGLTCLQDDGEIEIDVWLLVTDAARRDLKIRAFMERF